MQVKISGNQVLLVNNSYCAEGFLTFNGNTYTMGVFSCSHLIRYWIVKILNIC